MKLVAFSKFNFFAAATASADAAEDASEKLILQLEHKQSCREPRVVWVNDYYFFPKDNRFSHDY